VRRVAALLMITLGACAAPSAVAPRDLGAVAPGQRFEIFTRSTTLTADSIRIANDTLFAQRIAVHPSAPRTPVALPLMEVDSLRRDHTDRTALTSTLIPAIAVVALAVVMSVAWGSD